MSSGPHSKPAAAELQKLSPMQYEVTQQAATEPPFRNEFWDNHEPGHLRRRRDRRAALQLDRQIRFRHRLAELHAAARDGAVVEHDDSTLGMERVEVVSASGDSHLGHVFDDGPGADGPPLLHQLGVAPLRPGRQLEAEGYGEYLRRCFERRRRRTRSGPPRRRRDGASSPAAASGAWRTSSARSPACSRPRSATPAARTRIPTYEDVKTGTPGTPRRSHRLRSDEDLLRGPAREVVLPDARSDDAKRQGNDVGTQYRSAIFVTSTSAEARRRGGESARRQARASGRARSSPRSSTPARSRRPRSTTRTTWRRTRAATPATTCGTEGALLRDISREEEPSDGRETSGVRLVEA